MPPREVLLGIDRLSHDGRGIGSVGGKTVFVENALPGERVTARYLRVHGQYDELEAVEIHEASVWRVDPPCAHARVCGGCSLQHMDGDWQIRHKQQVLLDQLAHFGGVAPDDVAPPLAGERLGYRTKARLGVKYVRKQDQVLVGFREKHSRFLTAIGSCPVLVPAIGNHIEDLRHLLRGLSIFAEVPQIEVAFGDDRGALIIRHMQSFSVADLDRLRAFGEELGVAIHLQPGGPDSVNCLYSPWGEGDLRYAATGDCSLEFSPTDFTQINLQVNRLMVRQAVEWLEPRAQDEILDLFCGLGNFTLALARSCKAVAGVEGSEDMVRRAAGNARRNQIDNATFHVANLHDEAVLQGKPGPQWMRKFDALLLDPPRTGAEEVCRAIAALAPRRIVYVSCNPATLARDAGLLVRAGYRLRRAGVMDMFPHTTHVESMALFEKG